MWWNIGSPDLQSAVDGMPAQKTSIDKPQYVLRYWIFLLIFPQACSASEDRHRWGIAVKRPPLFLRIVGDAGRSIPPSGFSKLIISGENSSPGIVSDCGVCIERIGRNFIGLMESSISKVSLTYDRLMFTYTEWSIKLFLLFSIGRSNLLSCQTYAFDSLSEGASQL